MKHVCMVTTSPLIVNFFLVPHLIRLTTTYKVSLAVSVPGEVPLLALPGVNVIPIDIPRRISPLRDAASMLNMVHLFRKARFDLVHSFSPKAGLLAGFAGRAAGVPVRVHTYTGQVWATRRGPMRQILRTADRLTALHATHLLTDSPSQREFLVEQGVVPKSKCWVLGAGSVTGVDVLRFKPDASVRTSMRNQLKIPEQARVVLFLGRITRDKGVLDLASAFETIAKAIPDAILLIVGPDEDSLRPHIQKRAGAAVHRIRFADYTPRPQQFLMMADVLCLPSYREGFGSVIIEAAACSVPAVSTRIYGITDAVVENITGLLYAPGNVDELQKQLSRLLTDDELRSRMGKAARNRVVSEFAQQRLVSELAGFYGKILGA